MLPAYGRTGQPDVGLISIKGFTADDGEEIAIVKFESREALEAWRTRQRARES